MRPARFIVLLLLLITPLTIVIAQENTPSTTLYEWNAAGIRLEYPSNWNDPLPVEQDGQIGLQLAQALIDTPLESRPPGIPLINLSIIKDGAINNADITPLAAAALQAIGIDTLADSTEATLLGGPASEITGTSADGQLFGIARAGVMNVNDVVMMVGRAAAAQQDEFVSLFDQVASSLTTGDSAEAVEYGILWNTVRTMEDEDQGFLDLVGMAYGPQNRLYTFEPDLGVVEMDANTGEILRITPNEAITNPTGLAVTSTGAVYVSDTDCGCIYTLTADGVWLDQAAEASLAEATPTEAATDNSGDAGAATTDEGSQPVAEDNGVIDGFSADAPASIAVGSDDTLYATDFTSTGTVVVIPIRQRQPDTAIRVDSSLYEQPLLATAPDGSVVAFTQFGELFTLTAPNAVSAGTLGPVAEQITGFAITPDNTIAITTASEGITVLTMDGEFVAQVGRVVPGFPLPGEFVSPKGIAAGSDGTLYIADGDGTFGAVTAMSTGVASDRLGSTTLTPGLEAQGILSVDTSQQSWVYNATAGDQVTITALDNSGAGELDVALRLLAPDGSEIAANDDNDNPDLANPSDAQIAGQTLETTGSYIIRVERMAGEGSYTLGLTLTRPIEFDTDGVGSASGQLGFAFPAEHWTFTGRAGQTLTMTLEPTSGDLDPILRLFGPDGAIIDENDDAADPALGPASQLVDITLPADGLYTLEAARFDGTGRYELNIVTTS